MQGKVYCTDNILYHILYPDCMQQGILYFSDFTDSLRLYHILFPDCIQQGILYFSDFTKIFHVSQCSAFYLAQYFVQACETGINSCFRVINV